MMIRQSISLALLIVYIACVMILGEDDMEDRITEAERYYVSAEDYCSIDEFEEMDYYLFCDTQISKGAGDVKVSRLWSIMEQRQLKRQRNCIRDLEKNFLWKRK